jgi:hypothetical protein
MTRTSSWRYILALSATLTLASLAHAAVLTPATAGPAQDEVLATLTQYAGGELPFTAVPDDGTMDARIAQRLYQEAPSPRAVAVVAAAQLRLARGWLARGSIERGPLALSLMVVAARQAQVRLGDNALGVRICQAYLYPYLHLASPERWEGTSAEKLMVAAVARACATKDTPLIREAFELLIANTKDQLAADASRLTLADLLKDAGDLRGALTQLDAMDPNTPLQGARQVRAQIEAELAKTP